MRTYRARLPLERRWKTDCDFFFGSVQAQRLLFGHSKAGDLAKYIEAYFDTTTGPKRAATSYAAIAKSLGVNAESVLFVSDVEAGNWMRRGKAGMQTALMLRPETARPAAAKHGCVESFDELSERRERNQRLRDKGLELHGKRKEPIL